MEAVITLIGMVITTLVWSVVMKLLFPIILIGVVITTGTFFLIYLLRRRRKKTPKKKRFGPLCIARTCHQRFGPL